MTSALHIYAGVAPVVLGIIGLALAEYQLRRIRRRKDGLVGAITKVQERPSRKIGARERSKLRSK